VTRGIGVNPGALCKPTGGSDRGPRGPGRGGWIDLGDDTDR